MRIVAGKARGRPLGAPPRGVRPTSDKVREALYDVLGEVEGWRVLDLFAGTGALGLEALSRGAASVVFVDEDSRCSRAIRANAVRLDLAERVRILRAPVARALRTLGKEGTRFDLVLVDPPYGRGLASTALGAVLAFDVLEVRGRIAVETSTREDAPTVAGLDLSSEHRYGDTTLRFYGRMPKRTEVLRA